MAGKVRNLLDRDGRYFARLVVPVELREFVGRTELRKPLGPDWREALKKLPGAVALLQHEIALAERQAVAAGAKKVTVGRYPLADDQIALRNYTDRLAQDEAARNAGPQWASSPIDDGFVAQLRRGIAGQLTDAELADLVGHRIDRFRKIGNTTAAPGTDEWRTLARAICISEYEALSRVTERDEGDFTGKPAHPLIANAAPVVWKEPVSLKGLLEGYLKVLERGGQGKGARRNWTTPFDKLVTFLGHDDAARLTRENLLEWREALSETLSAKTIKDVYLAGVRAVLTWAKENGKIDDNPAADVRVRTPKAIRTREKGFTDAEALAILKLSRTYKPGAKEGPTMTAVKQWLPILCAFTGARVAEIAQLRKEDVRQDGETAVIRITPDAGSVKTSVYRDVPLHQQIIDQGFLAFVKAAKDGPLFHDLLADPYEGARRNGNRLSAWLAEKKVIPEGVQPNHAWRHRFKTIGREAEISDRVLDAIQGHAARTAGDSYGDVTIATKKKAIDRLKPYPL